MQKKHLLSCPAYNSLPVNAQITVHPVRSRRDLKRFIQLPYTLYRNNSCWIPSLRIEQAALLNPRKNPFYARGSVQPFLAVDASNRVTGRIAGIVNKTHLERYRDDVGFFGLFECKDLDVAHALFDAAAGWLRSSGLSHMRGPTNLTINEVSGVLVSGFEHPPFVMMPYNPDYYEAYILHCGFHPVMSMAAYKVTSKTVNRNRLSRGRAIAMERSPGIRLRKLVWRNYWDDVRTLHRLYNDAFAEGWGSVPMSEAEFLHAASKMKPVIDPHLAFFLEHNDRPVGFSLSLPNTNRWLKKIPDGRLFPFGFLKLLYQSRRENLDEFRTLILGILPAYRRRGLDAFLIGATVEEALKRGYTRAEVGWVMDDNVLMHNAIRAIGGVIDKRYAIYEKAI